MRPVLKRLYSLLNPGGILGITLKKGDKEGFEVDKRYMITETMQHPKKFFAYYEEDELNQLVTSVGFKIFRSPGSQLASDNYNKNTVFISALYQREVTVLDHCCCNLQ